MINEIHEKLNSIFCKVFSNDQILITEDTRADDVDGWDSLAHIKIIIQIEKMFNIRLNAYEVSNLENVGQVIRLIEKKLSNNA
jgi:acyl carrier protein